MVKSGSHKTGNTVGVFGETCLKTIISAVLFGVTNGAVVCIRVTVSCVSNTLCNQRASERKVMVLMDAC